MNLSEYQAAALVTAQPKAFSLHYLVPMIVGEIGELFGQKAKSHWHGWTADKLQAELVSEYGDVCWGTAILLHTHGVDSPPFNEQLTPYTRNGVATDPWGVLLRSGQFLHQWYSEVETHGYLVGQAQSLWQVLQNNCERITGKSFDTVLQANLAKLAGRVERGTLVGSGDHR